MIMCCKGVTCWNLVFLPPNSELLLHKVGRPKEKPPARRRKVHVVSCFLPNLSERKCLVGSCRGDDVDSMQALEHESACVDVFSSGTNVPQRMCMIG